MPTFGEGQCGVAVSDSPTGPFVVRTFNAELSRPLTGDLGLFVDDDGTGYLIYSSSIKTDHDVSIERLTPDLLTSTGESSGILAKHVESPALFRRGDLYYALFDTTSCFGPGGTGARVFVSRSPLGPFTEHENINRRSDCLPCGGNPTIPAQQAHVARLPSVDGDVYVWIGDRWGTALDGTRGHDHQYWSPPLRFRDDGSIEPIARVNSWSLELP